MKLFIDTDPGCDDILAIMYLLKHSTHEVVGMSSVVGNVDINNTTRNLRFITGIFNRELKSQIKVYKGASKPIVEVSKGDACFFHGEDGCCNFFSSDYYKSHMNDINETIGSVEVLDLPAAMGLIEMSKKYKGDLIIIALGPLTNIALAQIIDPQFGLRIKEIMIMGGEISGHGNSEFHPASEYNFDKDPEAAFVVFKEIKCQITVLPLEPNFPLSITQEMSEKWASNLSCRQDLCGVIMFTIINFQCKRNKTFRFYDLVLAMIFIDPSVVTSIMNVKLSVDLHGLYTRGTLLVDNSKRSKDNTESWVNVVKTLNRDTLLCKIETLFK